MKLSSLFGRGATPLIGLDVSASSIKLVQLDGAPDSDRYTLEHCNLEPLQPGWVEEGDIEKFDEVADAARRIVMRSATRAKEVALAMPASVVISKKIVLPAHLTDHEMEIQVEMEANQYIPFSLDEVSLDFTVIGPSSASEEDVDVMLTASRREKVEDRQALAEAIGLTPVVIEVDANASRLALDRLLRTEYELAPDAMVVLYELGGLSSTMQVLRGDEVLYEREQLFGGVQLTQALVRQYGFTTEEAEEKKRSGHLPSDYEDAVLAPFVSDLTQEIERSLKFFFTSTPNNKVDAIYLSGGASSAPGLEDAVADRTSTPCRLVDPFAGMAVATSVDRAELARIAPSCLTACGLAMRRFRK